MPENAKIHFTRRAQKYNHSSHWIEDKILIDAIQRLTAFTPQARVLDIAIGTGKISEAFYKKVQYVVGLDICPDMIEQAKKFVDAIVLSLAEKMPFKDDSFDICVCRQGLQFMEPTSALDEIYRVLRPGGRVVLSHLTAYSEDDKETTFRIQKLRNPARKNFFLPDDFSHMLKRGNFTSTEAIEYITKESVNRWIDNGAVDKVQMEKIRDIYHAASDAFREKHDIRFEDGDIFDSMKMFIVKGEKRRG